MNEAFCSFICVLVYLFALVFVLVLFIGFVAFSLVVFLVVSLACFGFWFMTVTFS
jgi:hypothetical protein